MDYYIEFTHDQSLWVTGSTFTNISENNRLLSFDIITKDFFEYDGWYNYKLYYANELDEELEIGKIYLKSEDDNFIYTTDTDEKIYDA